MNLVVKKKKLFFMVFLLILSLIAINPGFQDNKKILFRECALKTSQDAIVDGIVLNYTISSIMGDFNSVITYKHEILDTYNVTWWIQLSGQASWIENTTDRLISDNSGGGFNIGSHTPLWIFTNTNVSDGLLISVDGIGDHPFLVTSEFTYNFQGFGSIDVWQLEDLVDPEGFAWYEQSTGFLIFGNFSYSGSYYTMRLTHINFNFEHVEQISGLFDGLYVHHNITSGGGLPQISNFTYKERIPNVYNVSWYAGGMIGRWYEKITERIMMGAIIMAPNFGNGNHDPSWIHINVSLNDIVPIAVDGDGDYAFKVIGDSVQNLAGFGEVEVWILEDMSNPDSKAKYEKSTGILIDALFIYPGGNYTFDFINTNAQFEYYTPPSGGIPGYDLFIFLGIIGMLSLVILIKRRKT